MQDMPPGEAEISTTIYISARHGPNMRWFTIVYTRFSLGLGILGVDERQDIISCHSSQFTNRNLPRSDFVIWQFIL